MLPRYIRARGRFYNSRDYWRRAHVLFASMHATLLHDALLLETTASSFCYTYSTRVLQNLHIFLLYRPNIQELRNDGILAVDIEHAMHWIELELSARRSCSTPAARRHRPLFFAAVQFTV